MASNSVLSCQQPSVVNTGSLKILPQRQCQLESSSKSFIEKARYNAYTIWLFTRSDLKTIIFPSTVFALVNATASIRLGLAENDVPMVEILARTPLVLLYVWINLLPFAIDNQRQQSSIKEDGLNKPWRPMPSKRLKQSQATRLMFVLYVVALLMSIALGAPIQCIALMGFGYAYNDLNGADINPIIRNLMNGLGYVCFTSGALQALRGEDGPIRALAWWLSFIFMIVCTTVHSQDMCDQEGDALRNRKTMPLVVGDGIARYTIILPVAGWSFICPWLWECSLAAYVAVIGLGAVVMARTFLKRNVDADKKTFLLWNLWLTAVYCIPLVKSFRLA